MRLVFWSRSHSLLPLGRTLPTQAMGSNRRAMSSCRQVQLPEAEAKPYPSVIFLHPAMASWQEDGVNEQMTCPGPLKGLASDEQAPTEAVSPLCHWLLLHKPASRNKSWQTGHTYYCSRVCGSAKVMLLVWAELG